MAAAYSASKAAVIALAKAIGKDVAGTGVLVNAIAPAVIETPILAAISKEHVEYMLAAGAARPHGHRGGGREPGRLPRERGSQLLDGGHVRHLRRPRDLLSFGMASQTPDVLVLGGGFAGVVAARELRAAGHSVRLLEARDRLGGRTWFRTDALAGHDLEMGGAWIVPEQRHVWAEVQRYSLGPRSGACRARSGGSPAGPCATARCRCRPTSCPISSDSSSPCVRRRPTRPLAPAGRPGRRRSRRHPSGRLAGRSRPADAHPRARARLVLRVGVGDAGRVLDPRGRALARRRGREHLALARRERPRARARRRHGVADRGDRGGRGRGHPARSPVLSVSHDAEASPCTPEEAHRASIALRPQWSHCR